MGVGRVAVLVVRRGCLVIGLPPGVRPWLGVCWLCWWYRVVAASGPGLWHASCPCLWCGRRLARWWVSLLASPPVVVVRLCSWCWVVAVAGPSLGASGVPVRVVGLCFGRLWWLCVRRGLGGLSRRVGPPGHVVAVEEVCKVGLAAAARFGGSGCCGLWVPRAGRLGVVCRVGWDGCWAPPPSVHEVVPAKEQFADLCLLFLVLSGPPPSCFLEADPVRDDRLLGLAVPVPHSLLSAFPRLLLLLPVCPALHPLVGICIPPGCQFPVYIGLGDLTGGNPQVMLSHRHTRDGACPAAGPLPWLLAAVGSVWWSPPWPPPMSSPPLGPVGPGPVACWGAGFPGGGAVFHGGGIHSEGAAVSCWTAHSPKVGGRRGGSGAVAVRRGSGGVGVVFAVVAVSAGCTGWAFRLWGRLAGVAPPAAACGCWLPAPGAPGCCAGVALPGV